ncbi:MAG: hypothetical protein FWH53_00850 [Leptospirales bacterium]|nr:hypothetical protein [Leptospirales bacterium]
MEFADFFKNEKPCIFAEDTGTTVILSPLMTESISASIQVTDNTVEDGSIITDHIIKDPKTIELEIFLADDNDLLGKAADMAKSALELNVDTMTVQDKIEMLEAWQEMGSIVTYSGPIFSGLITTGYDITASSMLITRVDISRNTETGSGFNVSMSLKKITIAEAVMKNSKLPTQAKKTTKKGESSTKTESVEAKPTSILKRIFS